MHDHSNLRVGKTKPILEDFFYRYLMNRFKGNIEAVMKFSYNVCVCMMYVCVMCVCVCVCVCVYFMCVRVLCVRVKLYSGCVY